MGTKLGEGNSMQTHAMTETAGEDPSLVTFMDIDVSSRDFEDALPASKRIHNFYFIKFPLYGDAKLKAIVTEAEKEHHYRHQAWFEISEALKTKEIEYAEILLQLQPLLVKEDILDKKGREIEPLQTRKTYHASEASTKGYNYYFMAYEFKKQLIDVGFEQIRKEKRAVKAKIKYLQEQQKGISKKISSLEKELAIANRKRLKAYEALIELKKQQDEMDLAYNKSLSLLKNARNLARDKDIKALDKLSHLEVEKFMYEWSNNKAFRDDYGRRILASHDNRKLSWDSCTRRTEDKVLVQDGESFPNSNAGEPSENSKTNQQDSVRIREMKIEDEIKLEELEATAKSGDLENGSVSSNGIDDKSMERDKKEDDIAKAKLAVNKKKKQAKKATVKASLQANKKMPKGREKRAKKNASVDVHEVKPKQLNLKIETLVPSQTKKPKEVTLRYKRRSKGRDECTKFLLLQERLTTHWPLVALVASWTTVTVALEYYLK